MTLYENNIQYNEKGTMLNNSFMQYKYHPEEIWEICRSNLKAVMNRRPVHSVPKSIGEIVINTPAPALAQAIANATGIWFKDLPITSEQIAMGVLEKELEK